MGRPLTLTRMADKVPAILEAWLPGEEGGNAVADILFGDANPGGKLTMAFPRHAGQIPVFYNHRPSGGRSHWQEHYVETKVTPQYPFGYGLSYTEFKIDNLKIAPAQVQAGGTVSISVEVTNTGTRAGDEVVQLYTHNAATGITRPVKELRGFKRVTLEPGETRTVRFTLAANQLGFLRPRQAFRGGAGRGRCDGRQLVDRPALPGHLRDHRRDDGHRAEQGVFQHGGRCLTRQGCSHSVTSRLTPAFGPEPVTGHGEVIHFREATAS